MGQSSLLQAQTSKQVIVAEAGRRLGNLTQKHNYLNYLISAFNSSVRGENEAGLKATLERETKKMLAIMAMIISEVETEKHAIDDLLEMIGELDKEFFMYAQHGLQTGAIKPSESLMMLLALVGARGAART